MKRALVTGATKGIGRAITRALAAKGFSLDLVARSESGLRTALQELQEQAPDNHYRAHAVDLSDPGRRNDWIAELTQDAPPFSLLVNNAGLYLQGALLQEDPQHFTRMWQLNVQAPYELIRALVPAMIRAEKGHVINICSVASRDPQPESGSYSATKAALLSLTRSLRRELYHKHISVTAILPGQTWSASWKGADLPEHRLMQAADIAQAVVHSWSLAPSAVVEEIVLRPQQGDLGA